eukprot:g7058.t1
MASLTSLLQRYATTVSIVTCAPVSFYVSTTLLYDAEGYARRHQTLLPSQAFHPLMGRFIGGMETCALALSVLAFFSVFENDKIKDTKGGGAARRVFWCRMLNIPVWAMLISMLRFTFTPEYPMYETQYDHPKTFAVIAAVLFVGSVLFPENSGNEKKGPYTSTKAGGMNGMKGKDVAGGHSQTSSFMSLLRRYATASGIAACAPVSFFASTLLIYDPEGVARHQGALAPSEAFHPLIGRFICAYEICALSLSVLAFSSLLDGEGGKGGAAAANRVFWCRVLNIPVWGILIHLLRFPYTDPSHPMYEKQNNAPMLFGVMAAVHFVGSVLLPENTGKEPFTTSKAAGMGRKMIKMMKKAGEKK